MKDTDVRDPPDMISGRESSDTEGEKRESDDTGLKTVQLCHKTRDPVQLLHENTKVMS